jgi:uncharacterized membrane protein
MTGSLTALAIATLSFLASHLLLSYPPIRVPLVARLGEPAFRGVYSAVSLLLLTWMAAAYGDAPVVDLFYPPIGMQHLSLLIMPFACIFLVAGLTTPNPSAIGGDRPEILEDGPVGILKITRHPVMWGFALWGLAHLLANGDAASLILFGGITLLALVGARAQDGKKRIQLGDAWTRFAERTSFVPFVALVRGRVRMMPAELGWWRIGLGLAVYAALLWLHPWLFGVNPVPL